MRPTAPALLLLSFTGTLYAAENEPSRQLGTVTVEAQIEDGLLATEAGMAGKTPLARRDIPNSVSVLTRAQMDEQNLVSLWDGLQQITGVQAISNDATQGQYHARGMALDVQHDGMPSSMPLSGYQQFDLAIYDRIEVQRGPAGLLQGSGSFGGAVNLVRKRAGTQRAGSLVASAGSWNNLRGELDYGTPLNADGTLRARAVLSVVDREFFYDRVDDRKRLAYLAVDYDVAPSTALGAFVAWQDDRTPGFSGLPTYTNGTFLDVPRSFNPYPEWNRMAWDTLDAGLELRHAFANRWELTVKATRREQDFLFHDGYPTAGVNPATGTTSYARREFDYDYALNGLDTYLSGGFGLFGRQHTFVLGYNISRFLSTGRGVNPNQDASLNVPGVTLADPPAVPEPVFTYRTGSQSRTLQQGLYTQLRVSLAEPLSLVVGGRLSRFNARSRSIAPATPTNWAQGAREKDEFTPYAGLVWDVATNWSVYGSYSDVFAPQTQRTVSGSVLDPRVGRQLEAGVKADLAGGQLHATAALFNIRDENRAYPDPANTGFFVPLGKVQSEGAELEIVGRPLRGWEISGGYTYLRTEYLRHQSLEGQPLSYWYPKHALKLWSSYVFPGGTLQGLRLGGGVNAYGKSASGTSTPTVAARAQGSYAVVSVQAAYPLMPRLVASLSVNNLFDTRYYTRLGGTNTYNVYGEPTNASLTLRWSF